MDRTCGQ